MTTNWVPTWSPPNVRPLISSVLVGLGSLGLLALAFLPVFRDYSIVPTFVSIVGVFFAAVGLYSWTVTAALRRHVERERQQGRAVWPIRTQLVSKRYATGTLELGVEGLTISAGDHTMALRWEQLTTVDVTRPGAVRGRRLVVEGSEFQFEELTILDANAVTAVLSDDVVNLANLIRRLARK